MELFISSSSFTSLRLSPPPFHSYHFPLPLLLCTSCTIARKSFKFKLICTHLKPLRAQLNGNGGPQNPKDSDTLPGLWEDPDFVEVIGIGSRKDSVFDFCLQSPLRSSALRFWNIVMKDATNVQLQQRFVAEDASQRIVEVPVALTSSSKSAILVANAAYGSDHGIALDILKAVKSANGLAAGIILKPFGFEGRRRQDEVNDLVDRLHKHTNFSIVIDTDALLEKDLVTLDEALKMANNAVLMAMNAISILLSEQHLKFIDPPDNNVKEVGVPELMKILESYKEANIGFGAGNNIKASIVRAMYECPFTFVGVKDLSSVIVCIFASSGVISCNDVRTILHIFRQSTEFKGEVVLSIICEPNLESNQIVSTIITKGCIGQAAPQKSSIFSRLAQRFPFILNLLRKHDPQSESSDENHFTGSPHHGEIVSSPHFDELTDAISMDGKAESVNASSEDSQTLFSYSGNEITLSRGYASGSEDCEMEMLATNLDPFTTYSQNVEGAPTFHREQLIKRSTWPGYQIIQEGSKEGANDSASAALNDNLRIYRLPIGVKSSEESDCCNTPKNMHHLEKITEDDMKEQVTVTPNASWEAIADAGLTDFHNSTSAPGRGNNGNVSRKQGILSIRAASMLEAERHSQKKWSPMVVIKYRGGIYEGRCQGGLPEGKGRLSLEDGSVYEGMWRYGKRSGLGTFYFSNGDVYQGSWRDDVMHGKGWLYFHAGDRWFVNFWKGKANGEGRFYSKLGNVFFGHFKDGWRHGQFLSINVDGTRYAEIWDDGVLLSRKPLDSDVGPG